MAFVIPLHPTLSQTLDFTRFPGLGRVPPTWFNEIPEFRVGTFIFLFRHSGKIIPAFQDEKIVRFQVDSQCFDVSSLFGFRVVGEHVVVGYGKPSIFPSVSGDQSLREAAQTKHNRGIFTKARKATDHINALVDAAPPGLVYLVVRGLDGLGTILDRIRKWIKERKSHNHQICIILMFRKDEFIPDDAASIVSAWASFGFRIVHFSDEELLAHTVG
jgi:hypothetical protein